MFVELWSRPNRYDPDAGTLGTYLTVVARRRALDLVRSEMRRTGRISYYRGSEDSAQTVAVLPG